MEKEKKKVALLSVFAAIFLTFFSALDRVKSITIELITTT